ncbi:MAG: nucleotidyltransferase family protein, partial [Cyclobacteriaceae bacterium]|nr:nucleotidyltransferase family protein [Cyclobacteriaceae bacterium]
MGRNIPLLLLAAGSSSRMGQSKQLLNVNGELLIQKTVKTLLRSEMGPVIVVLGSEEQKHEAAIQILPIEIVSNPSWQRGMGTSIKKGIQYIDKHYPEAEGVLISVCDQPHLTSEHLVKLASALRGEFSISASLYGGNTGVPSIFLKNVFAELLKIEDADGARKVISRTPERVAQVAFPGGDIDLD